MTCAGCRSDYTAPAGNYLCPLCGSDLVVEAGTSFDDYPRKEDVTESLLFAYLTSAAVLAG